MNLNFFKLGWLSSKEREELKILRAEKIRIPLEDARVIKPYKNLIYNNRALTVVLLDKQILIKSDVTLEQYDKVKSLFSREEIISFMSDYNTQIKSNIELATPSEINIVKDNLGIFEDNKDFTLLNDQVFLKGVSLAIPVVITGTFIEILEKMKSADPIELSELKDSYQALKMFWLKLALNGIEQSREDLLNFVRKNDVKITRNGNLVLYRRIVSLANKQEEKDLIAFITQEYFKIKKWKKSPLNYSIYYNTNDSSRINYSIKNNKISTKDFQDNNYIIVGNLSDLYKNLDKRESNKYTSSHNRGKYTIQVGTIYKEDESNINLDNGNCAAGGLHAAAVDYDYSGFGDTPVVVLVNPSKAITVPVSDFKKLRTTEMFIAAINDKKHGVHFDEDTLTAFDEEYNDLTIQELETAIEEKSFAPAVVVDQISPITFLDMEHIRDMLKNRVEQI